MRPPEDIIREAVSLFNAKRYQESLAIYEKLLGHIDSPDFNMCLGLGSNYAYLGKHALAVHFLRLAIDQYPHFAPPWSNLGMALFTLGRRKEALNCYLKAIEVEPNHAPALANIAGWYINTGQPEKIIEYAARSLKADPKIAHGLTYMGFGLMELGEWEKAWPYYSHRWDLPEQVKHQRPYKAPLWDGKPVKKLAIHGEQGLGDEILFMSLLKKARERAEHVVVECADRLVDLFSLSFGLACYPDHRSLIETEGEPDAFCPMGHLPMFLGLPDGKPYLKAPAFERKAGRIGIAWRGGVDRTNKKE